MPGATSPCDPPSERVLPRYSTRKSLWKSATRASAFLTWSLASFSSAQALLTTAGEKGVAILEIGSLQQSLAAAEESLCDIAEPWSWAELRSPGGPKGIKDSIVQLKPNVIWIKPDYADIALLCNNPSKNDKQLHEVMWALQLCGSEQLGHNRSVVVETNGLNEEQQRQLRLQLQPYGNVTSHEFDGNRFLKIKANKEHETWMAEAEEHHEEHPRDKVGASGITFDKGVKPDVAATLRRLHQNLGHPSTSDLSRHLRLAGASTEVVKAAKSLTCETCKRCLGPRSSRPASEPKLMEFGDVVGVDMMFAYDIEKKKQKLLSIVDYASSYQVVVRVPNQTGDTLEKTFLKHWVQVFGAPKTITLDLETGIQDAFSRLSDWLQIDLQTSAGQAHWQAGFCERHGKWWKEIFTKVVEEKSVAGDDVEVAIGATSMAKNNLRRRCGWAPTQIVFGRTPRDEDDIHDKEVDEGNVLPQTPDDAQRRRESIRAAAKMAFLRVRAEDKIRRGSLQRSRVRPRELPNGEMALFWRKDKNNKKGAWRGPGVVIGRQHDNYWIARGGRCFLCAPEHVRPASPEELGGLFALRATQEDLQRLIERDHDDVAVFEEENDYDEEEFRDILEEMSVDEGGDAGEEPDFACGDTDDPGHRQRRTAEDSFGNQHGARIVRRRYREKGPQEAMMLRRATTKRGREKQLEKELPWKLIPPEKHALFREAEAKQWNEHLSLGALRPLSVEESDKVSGEEPDRIIGSRFA